MLPNKLLKKIEQRAQVNSLRKLGVPSHVIDFSSNDYLGFSQNKTIFNRTSEILKQQNLEYNGATGSRLLSGNHLLYTETERQLATFHNTEAGLIFNSGYDANIGFFSSVPQRGDIILYDELCHASIRDGIKMSNAKSYKFKHNDYEVLIQLLNKKTNILPLGEMPAGQRGLASYEQSEEREEGVEMPVGQRGFSTLNQEIYIITESVFSMDGDSPDLKKLTEISSKYNAHLVVDEAHAVGVFGIRGEGLIQKLELENKIFARVVTFGKALGCHGAVILGSLTLKTYLLNFARSFVYTTALPPHSVATIQAAYNELGISSEKRQTLKSNIAILQSKIVEHTLQQHFIFSNSAIQSCIVPGNNKVKHISEVLKKEGFDVKAILSPTVPQGQERLRICLHSYNTKEQIVKLVATLATQIGSICQEC